MSDTGDRGATQLSLCCVNRVGWVRVGSPPCPQNALGRTCCPERDQHHWGCVVWDTHWGRICFSLGEFIRKMWAFKHF